MNSSKVPECGIRLGGDYVPCPCNITSQTVDNVTYTCRGIQLTAFKYTDKINYDFMSLALVVVVVVEVVIVTIAAAVAAVVVVVVVVVVVATRVLV